MILTAACSPDPHQVHESKYEKWRGVTPPFSYYDTLDPALNAP